MRIAQQQRFAYDRNMDVEEDTDTAVARIAAAIGEPARARMLYCLMDDRARSSTELAVVAEVGPSTASAHLNRLLAEKLIRVSVQGKHRYFRLAGADVAKALEGLSVLAGSPGAVFVPTTPSHLRTARTCYDHIAGSLGVSLHDRFRNLGWLTGGAGNESTYDLTAKGTHAFTALGIDVEATRRLRRRFACACLDWSERRPHLGGALGARVLEFALKRKWLVRELDSRALALTRQGRREMLARFELRV
jgi:DNA-binding transcriptional ArsR family regulator